MTDRAGLAKVRAGGLRVDGVRSLHLLTGDPTGPSFEQLTDRGENLGIERPNRPTRVPKRLRLG